MPSAIDELDPGEGVAAVRPGDFEAGRGLRDLIVRQVAREDGRVGAASAVQLVIALAAVERVVARPAVERVAARSARELVGAAVALEHVVARVAGGVERFAAGQGHVLDVVEQRQRYRNRALDRVGALTGELGHDVARAVDHIGVVALAANELVVARTAVELVISQAAVERVVARPARKRVGGGVAGERILACVAGGIDRLAAGQDHVLDVAKRGNGLCDRAPDRVGPLTGALGDDIARVVDDVGVVAGPPAILSAPVPPSRRSAPASPVSMSSAASPNIESIDVVPTSLSLFLVPFSVAIIELQSTRGCTTSRPRSRRARGEQKAFETK